MVKSDAVFLLFSMDLALSIRASAIEGCPETFSRYAPRIIAS